MILLPLSHETAWAGFEPLLEAHTAICRAQLASMKTPYIPEGCDQQGRYSTGTRARAWPHTGCPTEPGPLTEAELDRAIARKRRPRVMPAIFAPEPRLYLPRKTWWQRIIERLR